MAKRVWAAMIALALFSCGCRADRHEPQTRAAMVVQASTQPADATASAGAPPARRVDVTVHEPSGSEATHTLVGHTCRVQFRRDALGMATPAPLPASAENSGGRPVAVVGKVVMVSEGWVVME